MTKVLYRQQSSTGCQTDWSLQASKPYIFVASSQVKVSKQSKKRSKNRSLYRLNSETETDEEEHSLLLQNSSTLPSELVITDQFSLDPDSKDFASDRANEYFQQALGGQDNLDLVANTDTFPKLEANIQAGADDVDFDSGNIDETFDDTNPVLGISLDKLMGGQDVGIEDESVHHFDSIVNDLVAGLIYKSDNAAHGTDHIGFSPEEDSRIVDTVFGDAPSEGKPFTPGHHEDHFELTSGDIDEGLVGGSSEFLPNIGSIHGSIGLADGDESAQGSPNFASLCEVSFHPPHLNFFLLLLS